MAARKRQDSSLSMSELNQPNFQPRSPFADPNPFEDPQTEPKPSPAPSSPASERFPSRGGSRGANLWASKHKFVSYRLKGEYPKPWMNHPRLKRTKLNNYIVIFFMILGVILSALICFMNARTVNKRPYCLVLEDNFETLDPNIWNHEVQIDGFGTGSFDWTTTDPKNSYVDKDGLHIVPTLTNETTDINNDMLYNGHTLNITAAGGDGSCTTNVTSSCSITSNSTLGNMIPPVRSARLTTKGKKTIKYGRVEVTAKLPIGDWLWPAIWMMPQDSVYGAWPASGEIDIMEARGNNYSYPGGRDVFTSTLHWGPSPDTDAFWRTTAGKALRRKDYSAAFHTYGLEWTDRYLFFYIDSRLKEVLFISFQDSKGFWKRGEFDTVADNPEFLPNPWGQSDSAGVPFDQEFFLILNVAVGARNGWFPDGKSGKPWVDAGTNAQWEFYGDAASWLPTWGEGASRGMTVRSVKMWQDGACK